jgi:hypothetical protein
MGTISLKNCETAKAAKTADRGFGVIAVEHTAAIPTMVELAPMVDVRLA